MAKVHNRNIGRGAGIRTPDLYVPNVARYQAALHPDIIGKGWNYNADLFKIKRMLTKFSCLKRVMSQPLTQPDLAAKVRRMNPQLNDWTAWKKHCARALCSEETQHRLGRFAISRFGIQLKRHLSVTNLVPDDVQRQLPQPEDSWHQFETYAALTQTREGKRYKDWIFARVQLSARSALDTIQSGATLIMRDVVRTFLCKEYAPRTTVSLDRPVGDGSITLGDLLPGSVQQEEGPEATELDLLAAEHAETLFQTMSRRERVGLFAKYSGLSLATPDLLVAADCGKSSLNQAVRKLMPRLRKGVVREYGEDGHNAVMAFTALMLQHLEKIIYLWKNSEKGLPDSFYR